MQTNTLEVPPLTEADAAALEAIMAEAGVDRDIAEHAFQEVRAEFRAEPQTAGVPEDEQYLRWYTRRRFLIEAEETRIADQMKAMLRTLAAKKAGLDYICRTNAEHITAKLVDGKKTKSVKLPHGTVGFRAVPGSVEFLPEKGADLMAWCKKHLPAAIAPPPPPSLLKTPISEHIKLSDEVPPGVKWNEPRDKFYVK